MKITKQQALRKIEELQRYVKESDEEEGFFDCVYTHREAAEALLELSAHTGVGPYAGHFVEIDGDVYFKLCMNNDTWFGSNGKRLLSEAYFKEHPKRRIKTQ